MLDALTVLIEQKSAFFARRGIPNLFARPGHVEFYREFAGKPAQAEGLAHVSQLLVGAQVVAVNFGLTFGGRYYYVLSSYTDGEMSRLGPGATHLHELMRYAIDKDLTIFDFTIGDEATSSIGATARNRSTTMLRYRLGAARGRRAGHRPEKAQAQDQADAAAVGLLQQGPQLGRLAGSEVASGTAGRRVGSEAT